MKFMGVISPLLGAVLFLSLTIVNGQPASGYYEYENFYNVRNESVVSADGTSYYSVEDIVVLFTTMDLSGLGLNDLQMYNHPTVWFGRTGQMVTVNDITTTVVTYPLLTIKQTIETFGSDPEKVYSHITIDNGAVDAHNVTITLLLDGELRIDCSSPAGTLGSATACTGTTGFTWIIPTLTASSSENVTFDLFPAGTLGRSLAQGDTWLNTEVTYSSPPADPGTFGPVTLSVCVARNNHLIPSLFYQHGFTALAFFLALIVGAALAIIVVCVYLRCCLHGRIADRMAGMRSRMLKNKGQKLVVDGAEAMRRGMNTIKDFWQADSSLIGAADSIVLILSLKDRLQIFREIDSMDIVSTIDIDTDIEKEQNDAAIEGTTLLIQGVRHNRDITPATEDQVIGNLRKNKSNLDRTLDEDYKRELKKLYKKLSAKNKARLSRTSSRQHEEKKNMIASFGTDLPDKDQKEVLRLLDEQHEREQNEETYRLKLEQDEETENLRKEFAVRKRMGLKEIQQQAVQEVVDQGKLHEEQADWLMKEHKKTQAAIEKMYDDEISRQRMMLEEKLARRKNLAQASEKQEDDERDLLNTMAGHQVTTIQKMKKDGVIDPAQADQLLEGAKQDMITIKDKMEKERERQEAELHKRLSAKKKMRLAEKAKQQDAELADYERQHKSQQTEGPVDPESFVEGHLNLVSQHRLEKSKLENEIDEEHAEELSRLRSDNAAETQKALDLSEQRLLDKLKTEGMSEQQMRKLLNQHDKELANLRAAQQRDREKQNQHFQEQLAKNRQEWAKRREAEKHEQEQLREHEADVVNKLINGQVVMSEEERDRILKEHEKQMVKLENSLTLNKLRQKRMLEEKLALKRAQQMEKLQQKQDKETDRQRRQQENNGEDSDDDSREAKLKLLKKHTEEKMAIMHGQQLDWEGEMQIVRVEMMRERALALKDQEERLGALVATLQLEKARELSKIEEQQKAINNLKSNLMDDLNDRGILSDPECQKVIERHRKDQEELNRKIESQRAKQEKSLNKRLADVKVERLNKFEQNQANELQLVDQEDDKILRRKLQERLDQRENTLLQQQDLELKQLVESAPNKTAAKIKRMLIIHKHMVDLEQFRNRLDREISQNLEEVRRKHQVYKMKVMQEQEMQFIAGLVRVGAVRKEELVNIIRMLFPLKSEEETSEMLALLYDPKQQPPQGEQDLNSSMTSSTLTERIHLTQMVGGPERPSSRLSASHTSSKLNDSYGGGPTKKRGSLRKKKKQFNFEESGEYEDSFSNLDTSFRPEPLGEVMEAVPIEPYGGRLSPLQATPARLPPIETTGKKGKKKKKLLQKLAHQDDY